MTITIDDRLQRVRAALAEGGYPNAQVRIGPVSGRLEYLDTTVPREMVWQARSIAGIPGRCKACFMADIAEEDCLEWDHFPATHSLDCGAER